MSAFLSASGSAPPQPPPPPLPPHHTSQPPQHPFSNLPQPYQISQLPFPTSAVSPNHSTFYTQPTYHPSTMRHPGSSPQVPYAPYSPHPAYPQVHLSGTPSTWSTQAGPSTSASHGADSMPNGGPEPTPRPQRARITPSRSTIAKTPTGSNSIQAPQQSIRPRIGSSGPSRMNWTQDVGSRISRGTLISCRTLEPFRPHVECSSSAIACVVWSSIPSVTPSTGAYGEREVGRPLPGLGLPGPSSVARVREGAGEEGAYDLTTWRTFRVLPILRSLPRLDGTQRTPTGHPYPPQLFFPLHPVLPPGSGFGGVAGFGQLRTVPAWEGGPAWVYFPAWEPLDLRVHWDPLADPTAPAVRLAHGEPERMLAYLKSWAGLGSQATEEELMSKLAEIGERERQLRTTAALAHSPNGEFGITYSPVYARPASTPEPAYMHVQTMTMPQPNMTDMQCEASQQLHMLPQQRPEPITPPPAPATPITPSNADELAPPKGKKRGSEELEEVGRSPECLEVLPNQHQPFSPVSIQLGPPPDHRNLEAVDSAETRENPEVPEVQEVQSPQGPNCANCHTDQTPLWRTRKETGEMLCNACSQYENMHGGSPRPPELFRNGSRRRGRWNAKSSGGPRSPEALRRSKSAASLVSSTQPAAAPAAGRGRKRTSLGKALSAPNIHDNQSSQKKRARAQKEEDLEEVRIKLEQEALAQACSPSAPAAPSEPPAPPVHSSPTITGGGVWSAPNHWESLDRLGYAPVGFADWTEEDAELTTPTKLGRESVSFHVSRNKQFQIPKGAFGFLGTPYSPLSKLPTWLELVFSKMDISPLDTGYRIWPQEDMQDTRRTNEQLTSSSHTTQNTENAQQETLMPTVQRTGPSPLRSPHSIISDVPLSPLTVHSDEDFEFINEPPSPCLSSILAHSPGRSPEWSSLVRSSPPPPSRPRQPLVAVAISFDLTRCSWVPDRYTDNSPRRWRRDACWTQREPPGLWRERGELEAWVREVQESTPEDRTVPRISPKRRVHASVVEEIAIGAVLEAGGGTKRKRRKTIA